ncbi:hypothetical protein L873DRAFT_1714947 [Choiromyces venosus 120613-1]|uniref:SWIM-type domain-containing protein n=1 Tax=Choiromyces venosus 120613-1 TaxID=1336337 RepID=A0A3N4J3X3_9PEZI|nr:hypothetical protein L873DRAFT_1714947 [Choiromyces venosus 120613-1]
MGKHPPTKRNWHGAQDDIRYERALTQKITIQSYTLSPVAPEITCAVRGSTGAKYTMYLSSQNVPDCSCPDCANGHVCKHIYGVIHQLLDGMGVSDVVYVEWDSPLIATAKAALERKVGGGSNKERRETAKNVPASLPSPLPAVPVPRTTTLLEPQTATLPVPWTTTAPTPALIPDPTPAPISASISAPTSAARSHSLPSPFALGQQISQYPNVEAEVDDLIPHINTHVLLRMLAISNPSVLDALRKYAGPCVDALDFANVKNQVLPIFHAIDNVPENAKFVAVRNIEDQMWELLNEIKLKTTKYSTFRARCTGFEVCLMVLRGVREVGVPFLRQKGLIKTSLDLMIHLDRKGDLVRKYDKEVMWWFGIYANLEGELFGKLVKEKGEFVILE